MSVTSFDPLEPHTTEQVHMESFITRNPELRELIAASNVTKTQIDDWRDKVMGAYKTFAIGLPETSAWRSGKIEHVVHGALAVREHASLFGLNANECELFAFLVTAHDVGRLTDEHRRISGTLVNWRHGKDSAEIVASILGPTAVTPLGTAMLLAIEHHSDIKTPSVEELGGSKATYALTALIRDADKMAGYDDAARYTSDGAFKQKQILTNFQTQRKDNPTFGDEKGRIEPDEFLDRFIAGNALDRRLCASYETYMLQYLAWLYDVQTPEMVEVIISRGGPKIVTRYLLAQLAEGAPEQHEKLLAWAKGYKGGLLLS